MRELLELARVVLSARKANDVVKTRTPALIIVDNKLLKSIDYEPKGT